MNFLFIFIGILLTFYIVKKSWQNYWLLISAYFIIGYFSIDSLLIIICSTLFNYLIGKAISKNKIKRPILYLGVGTNILSLLLLKSVDIAQLSVNPVSFKTDVILFAVGFSFYTIQNISYLIDVYNSDIKHEINIINFGIYNAFLPKLFAGPIELPKDFLPQVLKEKTFNKYDVIYGIQRIIIGLFKKFVLANRLAPLVSSVFDTPEANSGLTALIGGILFTIQIYLDFSGYTDIAIGTSKLFGFNIKENFNFPFKSKSISEFWRRWHISLINWITIYLYYPIVYKLRIWKKLSVIIAVLCTFLISGIWHGIGYTFLIWSLLFGIYISFEVMFRDRIKTPKVIGILITFLIVCLTNILFRSSSLFTAKKLYSEIFSFNNFLPQDVYKDFIYLFAQGGHQENVFNLISTTVLLVLFMLFEKQLSFKEDLKKIASIRIFAISVLIFMFGIFNSGEQFIYMQF